MDSLSPSEVKEAGPQRPTKTIAFIALFGVVLPCVALMFGIGMGMANHDENGFHPVPTPWHGLLIAWVPILNALLILALRGKLDWPARRLALASGLAAGVAFYYAILFAPLTPIGLMAIIWFGIGLLPLAPLLSLVCILLGRHALRKVNDAAGLAPPAPLWRGILLALLVMVLIDLPISLTRIGMHLASSDSPALQQAGLRWLRQAGSEKAMLNLCYGQARMAADIVGTVLNVQRAIGQEQARAIFYQVRGAPFASVQAHLNPAPIYWEPAAEPDPNGAPIKMFNADVKLESTRIDGSIDAGAALAYLEWTMSFSNSSWRTQEARASIALPPGAVVSRATLWVKGEEREAAFAGRAQVTAAYEKVVATRQDPLLVTSDGKDRVALRLFPIRPDSGEMKIRLGMTVPMRVSDSTHASLSLPTFSDRNFLMNPSLRPELMIESTSELLPLGGMRRVKGVALPYALFGDTAQTMPGQSALTITTLRPPGQSMAWSSDTRAGQDAMVQQNLVTLPTLAPTAVALVIDGSASMRAMQPGLAEATAALPSTARVLLVFAGDGAPTLFEHHADNPQATRQFVQGLRFEGGRDNGAALNSAAQWLASSDAGAAVWVHGPQPHAAPVAIDALLNDLRLRRGKLRLYPMALGGGPDLVSERFDGAAHIDNVPRAGSMRQDLVRLFEQWRPGSQHIVAQRQRLEGAAPPLANKTSEHLARLYAAERIAALAAHKGPPPAEAVQLAQQYQLVTTVSGAVVLETKEQYAEAGLTPVAAGSVPTIPEPETWMMMAVGLAILAWRYRYCRVALPGEGTS